MQAKTAFPAKLGLVGIFGLAGWTTHHNPEWLIATGDWPIAYLAAVSCSRLVCRGTSMAGGTALYNSMRNPKNEFLDGYANLLDRFK